MNSIKNMDKNKNLVFLGHHNYGLALLMDNVYEHFDKDCAIKIIHNQSLEKNTIRNKPFALSETKIKHCHIDDWTPSEEDQLFLTPISPKSRKTIYDQFKRKKGIKSSHFGINIHPFSVRSISAKHGHGLYMGSSAAISGFTNIGDHVIIMRNSVIGHHSKIADFVTLSGGIIVASNVEIEENVFIFAGVTIFDGVKIGKNSLIGAGSVVTKDIPENVVAYGNPCKVIRAID